MGRPLAPALTAASRRSGSCAVMCARSAKSAQDPLPTNPGDERAVGLVGTASGAAKPLEAVVASTSAAGHAAQAQRGAAKPEELCARFHKAYSQAHKHASISRATTDRPSGAGAGSHGAAVPTTAPTRA